MSNAATLRERQARVVQRMHEIFSAGLELKDRLDKGMRPDFNREYNRIRSLLLAGGTLDFEPIYRGDQLNFNPRSTTANVNRDNLYFGIQYPLACWLDEIFIVYAPRWWSVEWTAQTLEQDLLGGTQEREWRFWQQARLAEGPKGSPEAIECFLWAVMLGFRGNPESVSPAIDPVTWVNSTRSRVLTTRKEPFAEPPLREAPKDIPPLKGSARLRSMFRTLIIVFGISLFLVIVAIFKYTTGSKS